MNIFKRSKEDKVKDISEPVYTIVESLKNHKRWVYKIDKAGMFYKDIKTKFRLYVFYEHNLCDRNGEWMTTDEIEFVESALKEMIRVKNQEEQTNQSINKRNEVKELYGIKE